MSMYKGHGSSDHDDNGVPVPAPQEDCTPPPPPLPCNEPLSLLTYTTSHAFITPTKHLQKPLISFLNQLLKTLTLCAVLDEFKAWLNLCILKLPFYDHDSVGNAYVNSAPGPGGSSSTATSLELISNNADAKTIQVTLLYAAASLQALAASHGDSSIPVTKEASMCICRVAWAPSQRENSRTP